MNRKQLVDQIRAKQSCLCVGLDPDPARMPPHLARDSAGIAQFCLDIIDATEEYCVAYKPNIAFFEAFGLEGWKALHIVSEALPSTCFSIADAKRADIGNSSRMYARAFFEQMEFDAVTVAPYMGEDSIAPFLEYQDKWAIVLALTSNKGSKDFQFSADRGGTALYQRVIAGAREWGTNEQVMFVVGATHPEMMREARSSAGDYFMLVPGVGAQGGDMQAVISHASTDDCGLIINSTRQIIYASVDRNFARKAGEMAREVQRQMAALIPVI